MMMSSTKYEMMYQARNISSKIAMTAMSDEKIDRYSYLKNLKHCRFEVGYYDVNRKDIFSEISSFDLFEKGFSVKGKSCYAVLEDPDNHLGIHYIVLKESNLSFEITTLRMKIISYLILSFIFMGVVGYFLARLFLAPVRNKIESIDRFISDTTHELNTPISAILMTVSSIKGCDDKKLKRLEASAKRLSTMYGSLTYHLQGENREQNIEDISMPQLIEQRVDYFRELSDAKRIRVKTALEPLVASMDQESAIRLIDNLLSNAIKYSHMGGVVEVTIEDKRLIVADQGIGIEKALQKDIFGRYKRANKEQGGFGIGLDIVLSICKLYSIKIELESEPGEGSRFILIFP